MTVLVSPVYETGKVSRMVSITCTDCNRGPLVVTVRQAATRRAVARIAEAHSRDCGH